MTDDEYYASTYTVGEIIDAAQRLGWDSDQHSVSLLLVTLQEQREEQAGSALEGS